MDNSKRNPADTTRLKILTSASSLFSKHRISDVTVGKIMAEIGMTHGAFYKYFKSKEDLAEEVCNTEFQRTLRLWQDSILEADVISQCPARHMMSQYLFNAYEGDCPIVTFSHDAIDQSHGTSFLQAYREGTMALLNTLLPLMGEHSSSQAREQLLVQFSAMIGIGFLTQTFGKDTWFQEIKSSLLKNLE